MKLHLPILLAAGLVAAAATGSSATIVTYLDDTFVVGSTGGKPSVAASFVDSSVTATSIVNQVNGSTNANFSTGLYDAYAKSSYLPTKGTNASSTPWLYFGVTDNGSDTLNLSSLTFNYGYYLSSGSVSSFTTSYTVHYSTDNFLTIDNLVAGGSGSKTFTSLALATRDISGTANIDLTSIAGIGTSQTISFRIELAANVDNANLSYRVDNVALNGTFASSIPEPSTYALLLGGLTLGCAFLRRRRA